MLLAHVVTAVDIQVAIGENASPNTLPQSTSTNNNLNAPTCDDWGGDLCSQHDYSPPWRWREDWVELLKDIENNFNYRDRKNWFRRLILQLLKKKNLNNLQL